jgi:hypothetical protein
MSTLSTYTIEHLKMQVQHEGIRVGHVILLLKKILDSAEPVTATAVILLTVCLGVIAFMQVGDAGMILAVYSDTCRALPALMPAL